jgi:type IV pilus assembly protein PilC
MNIMTEYSRTLGLLIGAGTLVVESLNQVSQVVGNKVYENAIDSVSKRVEKGIGIGSAMNAVGVFPPLLVQVTTIGEQTGKLDDSLTRASEYYEREVDQLVKGLTTAMEPIIMLILGVGVAFLLISIITPIYKLTNAF